MKLYLAGQIRNNDNAEYRFNAIEQMLIEDGYEVFNPLSYIKTIGADKLPEKSIMAILIPELMACDGAYFMPNWFKSDGATFEHSLAVYLNKVAGFKILYG